MKIAVLVKQVPDTETKITAKADKSGVETAGAKFVMNPYDEFAVEAALQLGGESTAITLGPDSAVDVLRTALAMGVQSAIHIDSAGNWYDAYATAVILAKAIKDGGFELVLCGKQAIDADNSQVAAMIAELIGAPQVMIAEKIEAAGDKLKVTRRVGGGTKEIYESGYPLVIGAEKGLNTPRYASLPGIMKAKSKPIDKKSATELLGGESSLVSFGNYSLPPERAACKVIPGEPATQAAELVKLLRNEAKAI